MKPYKHQLKLSKQGYEVLKKNGLVYMSLLERTGKTLTSILIAEMSKAQNILVLTKKKAISGWNETLDAYEHTKNYTVVNYESCHKIEGSFDLAIMDEVHVMSAFKPGKVWKNVYKMTHELPIIYLSATPYAESIGQLYHQFKLTKYSPFRKHKTFYDFHRALGMPDKIRTPYGLVDTYKKFRTEEVLKLCEHLFISKTRQELGFEHEPTDKLHYYKQSEEVTKIIKDIVKTEMLKVGEIEEPLDSPMKLRVTVYQAEGGWIKYEDQCLQMPALDRIQAIKKVFGTGKDCAIMAHFRCEQGNLGKHFPDAVILSSNAHAEGVDLSHIENLIIYSSDFSTAKAFQRRARQANMKRKTPIIVHFFFAKGSMSEEVYTTVFKKKENFLKDSYERWRKSYD